MEAPYKMELKFFGEQNWFHGLLSRTAACSRLLDDGSFLVANDVNEPEKFFIFVKWNGKCHEVEIKYNFLTGKYSLGSVEFIDVADLVSYYKDNQLPVLDDLGAVLFVPVPPSPISHIKSTLNGALLGEFKNADYVIPTENRANSRSADNLSLDMEYLSLPECTASSPVRCKLQRQQIRYLPMNDKPPKYQNKNPNMSLGHLNTVSCESKSFSRSTLSLPTCSRFDASPKDSTFQYLVNMCQGFINYDLGLTFLNFIDVAKPLDEEAFDAVSRVVLSAGVDTVAGCLGNETASILALNWLSEAGTSNSLPTDGYSLLLWPAANGFRRDLYNRDRFLSLFVTASIVTLKNGDLKAALLALWVNVIKKLIAYHKDHYTANTIASGILAVQIMNQSLLWEKAFPCDGNPDVINKIKSSLLEHRVQESKLLEATSNCLSKVDQCVPNIAPLVEELYRLQPPDVAAGGLPPSSLMQKLTLAKSIYRRRVCGGGGGSGVLWVKQKWPELQSIQVPDELQSIFRIENILLLLLGPIDISQNDVLESCYGKLSEILTLFVDT
ncbi:unnamed protein product [Rodentolepis nana]|uniref:SH2 domain-containing protein n=1 Tax=Rodentolepis nana TaxID=102285 RepID=A0A0R3T704_RODNA|nr:unnamed protein product [Rodentolepis nana]